MSTLEIMNNNPECCANESFLLEMGKLRHSQVKWLGKGHTGSWHSWELNSECLSPQLCFKHKSCLSSFWLENTLGDKTKTNQWNSWLVTKEKHLQAMGKTSDQKSKLKGRHCSICTQGTTVQLWKIAILADLKRKPKSSTQVSSWDMSGHSPATLLIGGHMGKQVAEWGWLVRDQQRNVRGHS